MKSGRDTMTRQPSLNDDKIVQQLNDIYRIFGIFLACDIR